MKIDIRHIAKISKLSIPEDQIARYEEDMQAILDIVENPYNISFKEVEAAQIPSVLQDVDFAVINSNYALAANINPAENALRQEGAASAYGNIVAVKEGNEETAKTKALMAALESQKVADFIKTTYTGSVVSTVENPGTGFDEAVDYAALAGETITVAASPAPHAEILGIAKEKLDPAPPQSKTESRNFYNEDTKARKQGLTFL